MLFVFSYSITFRSHMLPTCTNLSVIVIDKPIGLGGTVYTSTSIFVLLLCTIYHQNKEKERKKENFKKKSEIRKNEIDI